MIEKVSEKDNTVSFLAELQKKQLAFVLAGGQMIQAEARVRTPVKTGNLRQSIQVEAYVEGGQSISETGPTAIYAEFVELGTSRQKAQPYMEPGFQAAKPRIDDYARKVLA